MSILSAEDLETVVRRAAKKLPPNAFGTPQIIYKERLIQVRSTLLEKINVWAWFFTPSERDLQ